MKNLTEHLTQYARYHRDRRNIFTHFVGIPMIVFAIAVLLSRPSWQVAELSVSLAWGMVLVLGAFYLRLDLRLGLLMTALITLCVWGAAKVAAQSTGVWLSAGIGLFVVGWIIQFVGHYFEGKKPAFVDDLMGLAVGPLFVVVEGLFMLGALTGLRQQVEQGAGPVRG